MKIIYRTPTLEDAHALAILGRTSFVEAFSHLYSPQDLDMFLSSAYALPAIQADLTDPNRLHLVAEESGQMLGFCKLGLDFNFDMDLGVRRGMELKQLYIRSARTGDGIGAALIEWAICEGKARRYNDIILSVWSGNHAGQRFYRRHGFEKVGDTFFMVGAQRDEEYLFGLRLTD